MTLAQAHALCDALVPDEQRPRRDRGPESGWTEVKSADQLDEAIARARREVESSPTKAEAGA